MMHPGSRSGASQSPPLPPRSVRFHTVPASPTLSFDLIILRPGLVYSWETLDGIWAGPIGRILSNRFRVSFPSFLPFLPSSLLPFPPFSPVRFSDSLCKKTKLHLCCLKLGGRFRRLKVSRPSPANETQHIPGFPPSTLSPSMQDSHNLPSFTRCFTRPNMSDLFNSSATHSTPPDPAYLLFVPACVFQ